MTKQRRRLLILVVLLVIVAGALQTPLLRTVRNWSWNIWVTGVAWTMNISLIPPEQKQLEELLAENIRLKTELKEYMRLSKDIGSPVFDDFKSVSAIIAGRPIDTFQSEFVINKGTAQGINLHDPVVIHGSILVGFISQLHEHSAVIRLLVHPSTTLAADVIDPALSVDEISTSGLLQGRFYTSLFLTTIPRDKPLHENSRVVTVAKHGQLPAGLFIGTVRTIYDQKDAAYKEAVLDIPYNTDELRGVTVLVLP